MKVTARAWNNERPINFKRSINALENLPLNAVLEISYEMNGFTLQSRRFFYRGAIPQ